MDLDLLTAIQLFTTVEGNMEQQVCQRIYTEIKLQSKTSVYEEQHREDICQEVFIALLGNRYSLPTFLTNGSICKYLWVTLRNKEISKHRAARQHLSLEQILHQQTSKKPFERTSHQPLMMSKHIEAISTSETSEQEISLKQDVTSAWILFEGQFLDFVVQQKRPTSQPLFRQTFKDLLDLKQEIISIKSLCERYEEKENTLEQRFSRMRRFMAEQLPAFIEQRSQEYLPLTPEQESWLDFFIQWLRIK
jgi:hypothetical protein